MEAKISAFLVEKAKIIAGVVAALEEKGLIVGGGFDGLTVRPANRDKAIAFITPGYDNTFLVEHLEVKELRFCTLTPSAVAVAVDAIVLFDGNADRGKSLAKVLPPLTIRKAA